MYPDGATVDAFVAQIHASNMACLRKLWKKAQKSCEQATNSRSAKTIREFESKHGGQVAVHKGYLSQI
jgi:hypothetical protein